jgi:hypothetical protein
MSRAGSFTGIFLLVVLNAKLSGTKSFAGIMNRRFWLPVGALLVLSPILVRIRWCLCVVPSHFETDRTIGMCPFGITNGASVLYLGMIRMLTSATKGYNSARPPLHVSPIFLLPFPLLLCRPSIHPNDPHSSSLRFSKP